MWCKRREEGQTMLSLYYMIRTFSLSQRSLVQFAWINIMTSKVTPCNGSRSRLVPVMCNGDLVVFICGTLAPQLLKRRSRGLGQIPIIWRIWQDSPMLRHDHTRTCPVLRQRMGRNIWSLEICLIPYGVLQFFSQS